MRHATITYLPGMSHQEFAAIIRDSLTRSKLVVTRGVDPTVDQRPFWDVVSESCGKGCVQLGEDFKTGDKSGSKWNEIRYDGSIQNAFRYSRNAQPLHTDGAYLAASPEIVFFYCIRQASAGGETVFLDSSRLISMLAGKEPDLLDQLRSVPVLFSKAKERKIRTIIGKDDMGDLLTWNYFTVDRSVGPEIRIMADHFQKFLEDEVVKRGLTYPVLLKPGDAVFFHDQRQLHGRNAFEAHEKDDRYLLKTAFDLGQKCRFEA
jgi:alpha-ketoglutarate-dependent taurine dioxygenase